MSQHFEVHPENPQPRLLRQATQILHAGGIAAIPTDSSYALVCHLDDKAAAERLRRIRGGVDQHHETRLWRDRSELASTVNELTGITAAAISGWIRPVTASAPATRLYASENRRLRRIVARVAWAPSAVAATSVIDGDRR